LTSSLALRHGVVWICRSAGVARVAPYDLGGRRLGEGFVVRGARGGTADVRGIAVDADRRIWTADAGSGSVRAFTAFGAECGGIDDPGLADASGIAVQGIEAELRLLGARRGARRDALRLVDPRSKASVALRSRGDPSAAFANLAGVALSGRLAFACEAGRSAVQVFRDAEFHYEIAWRGLRAGEAPFEPRAIAATADGRSIVAGRAAGSGAVFLFDAGGSFVRRLDEELAEGSESVDDDVSGVVVEEVGSERGSIVLVLDRGGTRVLAFTLDGGCLGAFHDLDGEPREELRAARAARDAGPILRPRRT
jgi:hypothetical protein